jgi:ribonuclease HI
MLSAILSARLSMNTMPADAARQMMVEVEATTSWVPREQNERADELSRQAYNRRQAA